MTRGTEQAVINFEHQWQRACLVSFWITSHEQLCSRSLTETRDVSSDDNEVTTNNLFLFVRLWKHAVQTLLQKCASNFL